MISLLSFFDYEFAQTALVGGVLFSIVAGLLGVFIVQRGLGFVGAGLAHSAFGGVALGLLFETSPLIVAAPFTILCALLMVVLQRKTRMRSDVVVGVLFAASMALGTLFLHMKRSASGDAMSFLFGDILALGWGEVIATAALTALVVGLSFRYWGRWGYAAFDEELARSQKVTVARDDILLLLLTALAVVIGVRMVGIFLLSAFLVIPASAARMASTSLAGMTIGAVLIALLSVLAGIFASFVADIPSGATIVLVQTLIFAAFALMPRKEG